MTHLPVPSHYLAVQFPKIKSKIPACLLSLTCLRPLQFLWFGDCLTARISNQSILKISPGCSLEEMMRKLKLQYFGHLMRRVDSLEKSQSDAGRDWGQEEMGTTEDEMARWHHWLDGSEFEWTPGVGDGQGGLVCCDSWGRKESDTTEQLNWTELSWTEPWYCFRCSLSFCSCPTQNSLWYDCSLW